jgi:hypothetical protein
MVHLDGHRSTVSIFPPSHSGVPDMQKRSDLILPGLSMAFAAIFAASTVSAQSNEPPKAEAGAAQSASPQSAQGTATDAAMPPKKTWADLDTDKDGNLNKTEAASIPSLQAVFDQADANADGALTGEEYKTYLAANGQQDKPVKPQK